MYYSLYVSLPFYVCSSVSPSLTLSLSVSLSPSLSLSLSLPLSLSPLSLSLSPDEVTMLVPSLLLYDPIDSEWVWSMSHPI